jgi:hypothetical protein
MNIQEIYELGLAQGWDEADAYYLATIAWAESKGDTNSITDEPNETQSFGIWQINSIHLPKLVEAGILHQPNSGGTAQDNLALLIGQLADPATNAKAAEYVGHRRDYSEPTEDWDFTRWSVHGLGPTDVNHPGKYGGDVTRSGISGVGVPEWAEAEVPDDFKSTITGTEEWKDRIAEWGLDNDQEDLALQYVFDQYNQFGDTISNFLMEAKDVEAMNSIGDLLKSLPISDIVPFDERRAALPQLEETYSPSNMTGHLPQGWMKFWGDDTTEVGDWWKKWEDIFEENRNREVGKFQWDDLEDDLLADLEKQGWWASHTENYRKLTQLWYTGGGPGGAITDGEMVLGAGARMVPEHGQTQSLLGRDYSGTGDWGATWNANVEVARSILEDLDERMDATWANANSAHVNNIAFMLMREGGASNHYYPNEAWATTAASKIERYAANNIFTQGSNPSLNTLGTEGLGAGTIQDIVNNLRNRAKGQLWDIDDATLREWAIQIKTEQGPNEAQRMAEIDAHAYGSWGLTPEEQEGMGQWAAQGSPGSTVSDLVHPLWGAAVGVWDDQSYTKDDQWLMDNYQVVADDGTKRFRTAVEMRNLARTNLDRSQHSSEYQDPMNRFITGAARMFRSDY